MYCLKISLRFPPKYTTLHLWSQAFNCSDLKDLAHLDEATNNII